MKVGIKMSDGDFATTILRAAEIREKSWFEGKGKNTGKYTLTIQDCIILAFDGDPQEDSIEDIPFAYPVYLMLTYAWNDSLSYAEGVLER